MAKLNAAIVALANFPVGDPEDRIVGPGLFTMKQSGIPYVAHRSLYAWLDRTAGSAAFQMSTNSCPYLLNIAVPLAAYSVIPLCTHAYCVYVVSH
eukprot:scaffold87_cov388-Prasinococcus_capsulatus_cf.AAC.23